MAHCEDVMDIHQLRDFVFSVLEEPLAELGGAELDKYDTGLSMSNGVIEIVVDGRAYELRIVAHDDYDK